MKQIVITRAVRISALEKMPLSRRRGFFSRREWALAIQKPRSAESLAARLAAKLGLLCLLRSAGYVGPVAPSNIEVLNYSGGRPRLLLSERRSRGYLRARRSSVLLSLAHTRKWGVATLLLRMS